jgi:hypothetical protein
MNILRKTVSILEVPLYLLIIGTLAISDGLYIISGFLIIASLIRLWVNHITYED